MPAAVAVAAGTVVAEVARTVAAEAVGSVPGIDVVAATRSGVGDHDLVDIVVDTVVAPKGMVAALEDTVVVW